MSSDQGRHVRTPRRLILVGAAWVVLTVGAVLGAVALDDPVGSGPRDEARPIVAGPIVDPGQELTGRDDGLPPLSLVLDRPLPQDLLSLPVAQRAERLRRIAATSADPRQLLELGVTYQQLGETPKAREAYRDALRIEEGNLSARVGLAMADAATGSQGQEAALAALMELEKESPSSQVVHFNRGWLEIYRRGSDQALESLRRVVELGPTTTLGRTAQQLVDAIERPPDAAPPEPEQLGG